MVLRSLLPPSVCSTHSSTWLLYQIGLKKKKKVFTHQNFVLGKLELLHGDHFLTVHGGFQGGLVHQVLQLGSGEAHGSSGNDLGLHSCSDVMNIK